MDLKINYDPLVQAFDLSFVNWDLAPEDGLETSILISLFSDARVTDDELPLGELDKRGFWGDAVNNPQGYALGSKLWLLDRSKITDEVLEEAREYCEQALQWLLEDSIAESVTVETRYIDNQSMGITIEIVRPSRNRVSSKFDFIWKGTGNGI